MNVFLFGQESKKISRDLKKSSAAKYTFSSSTDALLMTVKVWGEVIKPGVFDVPIGLDLVELLSSAGGPTDAAKLSKIRIIRGVALGNESEVEIIDVKEFLETGDHSLIPEIKPNDTVIVPKKPMQIISSSISWSTQVLSVVTAITMIQYYIARSSN